MPQQRPVPGWVITEDYEDEELGVLRAGKEAGCFLVRRQAADRYCLLVRKDYRKRSDRTYKGAPGAGERGIRRDTYAASLVILESRQRRAVDKLTSYGREVRDAAWAGREYSTLRRLWEAGASVPYPVSETTNGFLMQYIGTIGQAAPRLSDVRLERDEATRVFDRVVDELRILAREGIVHCDLSAYNVLMQHGRPWIIDLPQVIDLYEHHNGPELFERDVASLCGYFARQGVHRDPKRLARELLDGAV